MVLAKITVCNNWSCDLAVSLLCCKPNDNADNLNNNNDNDNDNNNDNDNDSDNDNDDDDNNFK